MRYFPINLDLQDKPVVVIGGGQVAARKVRVLLAAGGKVTVIDPKPLASLQKLASQKKIGLFRRCYRQGDLKGAFLAIASTNDRKVNLQIKAEALKRRVLINIIDKPECCDFVFPAVVRRGEFMITISTGGGSPAFAKKIREDLEKQFGPEYGEMVKLMKGLRKQLGQKLGGDPKRGEILTRLVRSPLLSYIRRGDRKRIDRLLMKGRRP